MSDHPTLNIVDDDEMSSQGSVNAPVAAPRTEAPIQSVGTQSSVMPSELPLRPQLLVTRVTPTVQSSVFAAPTIPVVGSLPSIGTVAPTIPVDVPSR